MRGFEWLQRVFSGRQVAPRRKRNYDAAQTGRRTAGWTRNSGDVNAINSRALVELRLHARDLERNNPYAGKALDIIAGNTVGWGIVPKPVGGDTRAASETWSTWADSTDCHSQGTLTMAGIQELALRCAARDGGALIRRRFRRPGDGFFLPLQLQVLEIDHLDTNKDGVGPAGGRIIQGVEFDKVGWIVAYWLFPDHPGSGYGASGESRRVPASEIVHLFKTDRPGQVRGVSWMASDISALKDFDDYEDAQLMKQRIAACFAAFVVDPQGDSTSIAEQDEADDAIETFEPGQVHYLQGSEDVRFAQPPTTEEGGFSTRTLRKIAAGMRVTYEDLTGDYSQVNFSSARMSRISHQREVGKWRYNMLIPQLCRPIWDWFVEASLLSGKIKAAPERASWTCPPLPMLEPDKEGLALQRLVRIGAMTPDQMVREQGYDPDEHWPAYAAEMKRIRDLGIILDTDVAKVSQAGQVQQSQGGASKPGEQTTETKEQ